MVSPYDSVADDEITQYAPPTKAEISQITEKSAQLLQAVVPTSGGLFAKADQPLKILKMADGTVHWGKLFGREEILALTNLAPPTPAQNDWENPPQYLCLFAWVKGHWVFRQFLGNAYDLEFHQHQGTYFLQGDYHEGRYGGVHLSWFYDAGTKKLVRTHFEDWGPFYITGDYLVCTRGFERRAHDVSHIVYRYKDRQKGAFVARMHENDSGRFDITFRNPRSGKLETWFFINNYEAPSHYSVSVAETKEKDAKDAEPDQQDDSSHSAQWEAGEDGSSDSGGYFQLLTGLNPKILGDEWLDVLPKPAPLKVPFIKATGDPDIVSRLSGISSHP